MIIKIEKRFLEGLFRTMCQWRVEMRANENWSEGR